MSAIKIWNTANVYPLRRPISNTCHKVWHKSIQGAKNDIKALRECCGLRTYQGIIHAWFLVYHCFRFMTAMTLWLHITTFSAFICISTIHRHTRHRELCHAHISRVIAMHKGYSAAYNDYKQREDNNV